MLLLYDGNDIDDDNSGSNDGDDGVFGCNDGDDGVSGRKGGGNDEDERGFQLEGEQTVTDR